MPDVLMTDVASVSDRELEDLRSACAWSENTIGSQDASRGRVGKSGDIDRPEKSR
jgi:hypothetical protein